MNTYVEEEEELAELEEDLASKRRSVADADLRKSMGQEGTMQDISDDPEIDTLWSMVDGMRIEIPHFMTARTLRKRLPSGGRMFTANRSAAPKYQTGNVLCWLHADHPRRAEWNRMGLAGKVCPASHLASPYSARIHMQHRHKDEWAAIESYGQEQREDEYRRMAQQQLEATLALANRAAGVVPQAPDAITISAPAPVTMTCECGWETAKGELSLATHKRLHCPLRAGANAPAPPEEVN